MAYSDTSETEDFELSAEGPRFWTHEWLRQVVERILGWQHFIVVSNREPYVHHLVGEEVVCIRPVSGVVTALEPVMRVCGGSWVAHASGDADRDAADARGCLPVPPEDPRYTLR
jgi:trehalose-6-phosphate synthase